MSSTNTNTYVYKWLGNLHLLHLLLRSPTFERDQWYTSFNGWCQGIFHFGGRLVEWECFHFCLKFGWYQILVAPSSVVAMGVSHFGVSTVVSQVEGIEGTVPLTSLNTNLIDICLTLSSTLSHPKLAKCVGIRWVMGLRPRCSLISLFWDVWSLVCIDIEMLENREVEI